jgi:hypothetical protein
MPGGEEDPPLGGRDRGKLRNLAQRGSRRLLDQHIPPGEQRRACRLEPPGRGRADRHELHIGHRLIEFLLRAEARQVVHRRASPADDRREFEILVGKD